jgi:phosphate/phosphite/phosphonate ABC transporter binding protein
VRQRVLIAALLTVTACRQRPTTETLPAAPVVEAEATRTAAMPSRSLRLGHPPNLSVKGSQAEYRPLAEYLTQALQHNVFVVVPDTYGEVVDLLVDGELDFALLTPFLYVRAKKRLPALKLVASLLGEGAAQYRGYIVTAAASPIHDVKGLKGKRFAFVDKASASGYLFPLAVLKENGIDPDRDLKEVVFAGSHRKVVDWILEGRVDAGAVSSTSFVQFRGEAISSRLFIIAKTDWIPLDAFVARPDLPEPLVAKVKTALLSLDARTAEGRNILSGVATNNGFVEGKDEIYAPVRKIADKLGLE